MDILIKNMEKPLQGMFEEIRVWDDGRVDIYDCESESYIPATTAIPVPEHKDLIDRGWHLGEPSESEQGWFLTKVIVRDCDGSFFTEYEACFKYEEWVSRRHRQPVVAYQLIEPTEVI